MDDENIASFVAITGASEDAARQVLEMCGGDFESAVSLWYSDEELQRNVTAGGATPAASTSRAAAPPPIPHSTRPNIGRQDERGVIHLDSDDEDDINEADMVVDDDDDTVNAVTVARTAQEEEDAAMAKRLQEELYSGQAADEDGVRAPIARTTETLVGPNSHWPVDDDEDMNAAIMEQLRRRRAPPARRPNPFAQSIWDDAANPARSAPGTSEAPQNRAQRLAELFRPPYDLMSQLSWDEARQEGKDEKKWILVNLQNMSDFNCQALNRDIWKDGPIQQLVRENFIFLQYDKDDFQANSYIQFYFPNSTHENPDNYPHVGIVDPRTGEQVKVWSGIPFPNALDFHAQLAEFLDRYSLAANSKNPVSKAKRPQKTVDVDRMTEEEMLEMALQNSLEANGNSPKPNLHDPDAFTKASQDAEGKGKAPEDPDAMEAVATPAPSNSPFASIPADRPHTEPAGPAGTTRIQFRHPTGRVIRKFELGDPVQRIYEWLKAEPLADKAGVDFELKAMPQGHDLIEDLDKTIEEAGLKMGTVMIEFLE